MHQTWAWGGGGGMGGMTIFCPYGTSCRDFGANFKNSKIFAAFGRNQGGDPYLLAAASRPKVILSSACPVRRGVHVASYMLVLQRSGQGGTVCT